MSPSSRRTRRGFTPTDRIFLGYLVLNTLLLMYHARDVDSWPLLLAANALSLGLVMLLARAPITRLTAFLGGAYALILTAAFYPQLGIINTGVGLVHDQLVQRWDAALFGGQVSITWHRAQPGWLLSSVLHFCYGSFYWVVLFAPLFLFLRRSREAFERAGFVLTLALYACYLVFGLFPVAGPRYFYGAATGPAAEVFAARIVHAVLEGGSAWGTAFPSSHVAAAWAAVFVLWREARPVALALLPIALGVPLGTVYGQFHYGMDAVTGSAVALALCALADPLRNALERARPPDPRMPAKAVITQARRKASG